MKPEDKIQVGECALCRRTRKLIYLPKYKDYYCDACGED